MYIFKKSIFIFVIFIYFIIYYIKNKKKRNLDLLRSFWYDLSLLVSLDCVSLSDVCVCVCDQARSERDFLSSRDVSQLSPVLSTAKDLSYVPRRELVIRGHLAPGHYIIIPSTSETSQEGEFLLRVLTEKANETTWVKLTHMQESHERDLLKILFDSSGIKYRTNLRCLFWETDSRNLMHITNIVSDFA